MPSLSLCMIVKNVEKTIKKTLDSILPYIDELVVTDTGSIDGTESVIKKKAPHVRWLTFTPSTHPRAFLLDSQQTWPDTQGLAPFTDRMMLADFGAARQFGWEKATGDFVMWLDSDDLFEGGKKLREIIANMEKEKLDTALFNYDYATDHLGNVNCKLTRERLVRRSTGSCWHNPIHEVFLPIGRGRFYEECNIKHMRHQYGLQPENQHRNLKVLCKWQEREKDNKHKDPRMLFYLGMEERFIWPNKAIDHFKEYCELSGWDEERGIAHIIMGTLYEKSGRYPEAFSDYSQAALEASWNPDPFFGAARVAYFKKDWEKCIEWTLKGFEIDKKTHDRKAALMFDPLDRIYRPYIYYSAALIETGRMKEAVTACEKGLIYNPEDPHLKGNKEVAENFLSGQTKETRTMSGNVQLKFRADEPLETPPIDIPNDVMIAFALQMWKRSTSEGLHVKALQLLDSLPTAIGYHEKVRRAREMTLKSLEEAPNADAPKQEKKESEPKEQAQPETTPPSPIPESKPRIEVGNGKYNVIIWTGPGWENWSPKSLDTTGIGGSETAAVCMARELTKIGHKVTVLSQCGDMEGQYDGVNYAHFERATKHPEDFPSDIFISSRHPHVFEFPFKYKASFVWAHDIHVGHPTAKLGQQLLKVDRFFCLSNWHKEFFLETYPFLYKDRIIVTKNGIDLNYFKELPQKEGNKLIYSSSPDRGLERLLDLFPRIRAEVPDAELHIYYGFHNWKKMAETFGNSEELQKIKFFEDLLEEKSKQGGIVYHGRVSKPELAHAFLTAKVWPYPTWFTETYCITAIEAQAAGCVPVTTALAALPETVSHGFILKPPNTAEEYGNAFVKRVVNLLQNEENRAKFAEAGREFTFKYHGWDQVASAWEHHFHETLKAKAENPLPAFGDF